MRKLSANGWRLAWVLMTNGVICLLLLSGPIRWRHNQMMLYRVMRTTPPAFSYWKELFATPWVPIVLLLLVVGAIAEVRRSVLGPVVNLGFYATYLGLILFEQAKAAYQGSPQETTLGFVLIVLVIPLAVITAVDLVFYIPALRHFSEQSGE
jgi:hypothetical protein